MRSTPSPLASARSYTRKPRGLAGGARTALSASIHGDRYIDEREVRPKADDANARASGLSTTATLAPAAPRAATTTAGADACVGPRA